MSTQRSSSIWCTVACRLSRISSSTFHSFFPIPTFMTASDVACVWICLCVCVWPRWNTTTRSRVWQFIVAIHSNSARTIVNAPNSDIRNIGLSSKRNFPLFKSSIRLLFTCCLHHTWFNSLVSNAFPLRIRSSWRANREFHIKTAQLPSHWQKTSELSRSIIWFIHNNVRRRELHHTICYCLFWNVVIGAVHLVNLAKFFERNQSTENVVHKNASELACQRIWVAQQGDNGVCETSLGHNIHVIRSVKHVPIDADAWWRTRISNSTRYGYATISVSRSRIPTTAWNASTAWIECCS